MTAVPIELGVKLLVEKVQPTVAGRLAQESATGFAYPFNAFTFTLKVPFDPAFTEVEGVGDVTWKSVVFMLRDSQGTVKRSFAHGVTPRVVVTVTVDGLPGRTVAGFAEHDIPAARFAQPTVIG